MKRTFISQPEGTASFCSLLCKPDGIHARELIRAMIESKYDEEIHNSL